MSNAEADELFPPASQDEADRRYQQVQAAVAAVQSMSTEERSGPPFPMVTWPAPSGGAAPAPMVPGRRARPQRAPTLRRRSPAPLAVYRTAGRAVFDGGGRVLARGGQGRSG